MCNIGHSVTGRALRAVAVVAVTLFAGAGCSKEIAVDVSVSRRTTILVSLPSDDVRTAMDPEGVDGSHAVKWCEGDCININGFTSIPLSAESAGESGASFVFESAISKPYNAVYPASAYVSQTSVVLPAVQRKSSMEGSFGPEADLLLGTSDDSGAVKMHHACAAVKLQIRLKDDADTIAYVEFKGNNLEQVSGLFNANVADATISGTSTASDDRKVRVLCGRPATTAGISVVAMVPARAYSGGFTVTVVDKYGHAMDKSTTGSKTLSAGSIAVMPAFDFEPTKTVFDVILAGADDLVHFASDWNAGKYSGRQHLSVTLSADAAFNSGSSTSFAATGGIGSPEYPFDGVFDAAGHSISGLTSSVPVFSRVASAGCVRNLTISSSCSFSATSALVGALEGSLEDCCVKAALYHKSPLSEDCLVGALAATAAEGSLISGCTGEGGVLVESTASALSPNKLYVGGIVAISDGTIRDCTNRSLVEAVLNYACKDVRMGGIAASSNVATAIEDCTNEGKVHLNGTAVTQEVSSSREKNTEASLAGIIGRSAAPVAVSKCSNSGEINYDFNLSTKVNQRPSSVGGIAGWLSGAGSKITGCVNSGKLCNYNFNNSSDVDLCVTEGGIVAVCLGAGSSVTSCSSLGENTIQIQRGIQGGIAGWVEGCSISSCESEVKTVACASNIPMTAGGIAGKCVSSTINLCKTNGVYMCCKTSAPTSIGSIAGSIDGASKITGCTIINTRLARNGSDTFTAGAVAGKVEAESGEISGCSIDSYRSIDSGSSWTKFGLDQVSGSGAFAVSSANSLLDELPYNLAGHVRCSGMPLAGVVVSDGFQSVKTDANGFFSMTGNLSKVHMVSVCVPEGYAAPNVDGLPKFYAAVNGAPTTNISFSLKKISGAADNYTMIFSADPQPRSSSAYYDKIAYHSQDCTKDLYRDIGATAGEISGEQVYGMVLGDVVHETMSLFDTHCNNLSAYCSGMSTYHVIGNHDYNKSAADMAAGAANFENHFGPTRYSVNLGKFHFVVLDDLIMNYSGGTLQDYNNGLSDDVYIWLVSDLKWVDSSTPVVICTHGPMYAKHNGGTGRTYVHRSATNGTNYAKLLSRFSKVLNFAGHIHNTFNFIFKKEDASEEYCSNVECFSLARSCGALWLNEYLNCDGTPRGYLVMKVRGKDFSWKFTPVAHQTGSFAASYSMPSYSWRDWTYSGGVAKIDSQTLSDDYQMKVYPNVNFNGVDYIMANIFFWDALWATPKLCYTTDSGAEKTVSLSRAAISTKIYDYAFDELNRYYCDKSSYWRSENVDSSGNLEAPYISPHMFRCSPPTDGHKGRVEVTDRFGNTFTSHEITW